MRLIIQLTTTMCLLCQRRPLTLGHHRNAVCRHVPCQSPCQPGHDTCLYVLAHLSGRHGSAVFAPHRKTKNHCVRHLQCLAQFAEHLCCQDPLQPLSLGSSTSPFCVDIFILYLFSRKSTMTELPLLGGDLGKIEGFGYDLVVDSA